MPEHTAHHYHQQQRASGFVDTGQREVSGSVDPTATQTPVIEAITLCSRGSEAKREMEYSAQRHIHRVTVT